MNTKETKKPTNSQLLKRINKAVVHVDRTKDTKDIFFSDRGLKLTVNEEYAVIATGYHKHVFSRYTSSGISKPYIYTDTVLTVAFENDCIVKDEQGNSGYSYQKLLATLKNAEDKKAEYLIVYYYSMWLFNIFNPLYTIGETEQTTFITYVDYLVNIARNAIVLGEHNEDMTNKQFIAELCKNINDFTSNVDERVIFKKMTDEEFAQQEMDAMNEYENEEILTKQIIEENGNKGKR